MIAKETITDQIPQLLYIDSYKKLPRHADGATDLGRRSYHGHSSYSGFLEIRVNGSHVKKETTIVMCVKA
jgi:hypothetical protein